MIMKSDNFSMIYQMFLYTFYYIFYVCSDLIQKMRTQSFVSAHPNSKILKN